MLSTHLLKVGACALCIGLSGCERGVSFADDVQPILQSSCVQCHDKSAEGYVASGFSLEDYESVMKGTNFGAVVVPNSSMSSTLYLVVAHKTDPAIHMPPHHDKALAEGRGLSLTDEQIEMIAAWIDQGAKNN
ncbi:MAG: hypothetical protein OEM25_07375 [Gammaproteobacteria bacterium]|nr:hypothetical protein [Gammaproteobacteria bacterium]